MPYLESLSTAELAELAGRNGLDIPPNLERVFIIGELLEFERMDARWDGHRRGEGGEGGDMATDLSVGEPVGELKELPEQYGMSYIDVLIRDPLWVFAFWEVKRQARGLQEEGADSVEYCLRIVPLRGNDLLADTTASFTVSVGTNDRSLYLGIPHEDGRCFRVELCTRQGAVLAVSRPFSLPRLVAEAPRDDGVRAVYDNTLSELSGVKRFSLVRSVDRLHRCKGL